MTDTKKKGDILEDLVALIYEEPFLKIEKRKRIKRLSGKKRPEIDVLITGKIANYDIRLAIECKNEKKKFNIVDARNFKAKLDDIGIPKQNGIVVALTGFTKDAQEYLDDHQIRTYIFEGLTKDRLSKAVYECFQSHIFYGARWKNVSTFSLLPKSAFENNNFNSTIKFIEGSYSKFSLNSTTGNEEAREKIISDFPDNQTLRNLEIITSEKELNDHKDITDAFDIVKTRIPRLFMASYFWPPSGQAVERISNLLKSNQIVTFEKVEGHDLNVAWNEYSEETRQFFLSKIMNNVEF